MDLELQKATYKNSKRRLENITLTLCQLREKELRGIMGNGDRRKHTETVRELKTQRRIIQMAHKEICQKICKAAGVKKIRDFLKLFTNMPANSIVTVTSGEYNQIVAQQTITPETIQLAHNRAITVKTKQNPEESADALKNLGDLLGKAKPEVIKAYYAKNDK